MKFLTRTLMVIFLMVIGVPFLSAQTVGKYRVMLTDKKKTTYSLKRPAEYLSEKAVARRLRLGLSFDSTDLPVCRKYLKRIQKHAEVLHTSRWNNTAVVRTSDSLAVEKIKRLPFVREVRKIAVEADSIPPRNAKRKEMVRDTIKAYFEELPYGFSTGQVRMLGVDSLHAAGFRGQGMTIAVIDGGYFNTDTLPLLKHAKILGTRDFVNPASDIYAENAHGTQVLSCMAANMPHVLVGTAPEASYWLLRSEDTDSEQLVELDNWMAALEFADSVGADLVNTSLGYAQFDDPTQNFKYHQLDGRTILASRSASLAASKGMLLVCSAGNSGNDAWKKITPPGDADNVLTVGAVTADSVNAKFSSVGNTADGRIKPDVMAQGVNTAVVKTTGGVRTSNGTSFASPVMCGGVACLWQAFPMLTPVQMIDLVRLAGHNEYPDNIFGYGIPNLWKAYLENK